MRPLVLAFFLLSGVSGLLYEVVWVRVAGTVIGNTTYAMGTVVAVFMGGLAAGAWLGGRAADRRSGAALLRLYGLLEAGVALSALAVPFLLVASEPIFRIAWNSVGQVTALYESLRVLLVALLLLAPTTLMGATLPVLARYLAEGGTSAPREAARAYSVNTLGGFLGTLAAGFWLVPSYGLRATTFTAAAINLLIAGSSLALARGRGGKVRASLEPSAPPGRLVLGVAAVSGFAALVYETAWTRALVLSVGSTVTAFTIILAAFILGLAAGSAAAARFVTRNENALRSLAAAQAAAGILAVALLPILGDVPLYVAEFLEAPGARYPRLVATQAALAFLFVFVPSVILGTIFPWTCRLAAPEAGGVGRSVGAVYTWNTLGSIAGSAGAAFLLIPHLGVSGTVKLAAAANLLLSAGLLLRTGGSARRWAALPALALVGALFLPAWNPNVMASGAFLYSSRYLQNRERTGDLQAAIELEGRIVAQYWDSYGLVTVHEQQQGVLALSVNGKVDASTGGTDTITQYLLAHVPLLHHPDPKEVLVIGLGGGFTAAAAARHPIRRLDCVEISPAVARAARHFSKVNGAVLDDPRMNLRLADGRNAVKFSRASYDVIISEPSNLWLSGMASLFTRDFFEEVKARLAPGGLFCQWVHAYRLSTEDFQCVLRTFASSFPHGSLWEVLPGTDYILVGSLAPSPIPYSLLEDRLARGVAPEILDPAFPGALSLMGHLAADLDAVRVRLDPGPVITDDLCPIEHTAARALYLDSRPTTIAWLDLVRHGTPQQALYTGLAGPAATAVAERREGRRRVAEAMQMYVAGRPLEGIRLISSLRARYGRDAQTRVWLEQTAMDLRVLAEQAFSAGQGERAIPLLAAIPPEVPAYADAQVMLGDVHRMAGRVAEARARYEAARRGAPKSFGALVGLAFLLEIEEKIPEAARAWEEAIQVDPKVAAAHLQHARCLLRTGRPEEASKAAARALECNPSPEDFEAARRLIQDVRPR